MILTGMKYRFSARFHRVQTFFVKTEGWPLWVLSRNSIFFKTPKNCTTLKYLSKIECGLHGDEIWTLCMSSP
jgi:hypothetical protein